MQMATVSLSNEKGTLKQDKRVQPGAFLFAAIPDCVVIFTFFPCIPCMHAPLIYNHLHVHCHLYEDEDGCCMQSENLRSLQTAWG